MKRIAIALSLLAGMLFAAAPVVAQTPATVKICVPTSTTTCPPVGPSTPFPVSTSPYQFVPAGTMQSQLAVTTGGVVTLTVPAGTLLAVVCVRSGGSAINFSDDGTTTPTTTATGAGRQLSPGFCVPIQGNTLINNFKAIGATTTTAIDVEYDK